MNGPQAAKNIRWQDMDTQSGLDLPSLRQGFRPKGIRWEGIVLLVVAGASAVFSVCAIIGIYTIVFP